MQTTEEVRLRFLLPSMTAISARPLKVIGTFLVTSLLGAMLAPDLWNSLELLRVFAFASTTTVLAGAGAVRALNRLPRKPKEPKRRLAKLRSAGSRPSPVIPLLMSRCVICNRPLRDPQSMRAGVGPDCWRRYGAQPQYQPNPAYALWERRVEQLRREQQEEQRQYDVEHAREMARHQQQMRQWQAEMATPTNQARAQAQQVATHTVFVDLGVLTSFLLSDLVARAVAQADGALL